MLTTSLGFLKLPRIEHHLSHVALRRRQNWQSQCSSRSCHVRHQSWTNFLWLRDVKNLFSQSPTRVSGFDASRLLNLLLGEADVISILRSLEALVRYEPNTKEFVIRFGLAHADTRQSIRV